MFCFPFSIDSDACVEPESKWRCQLEREETMAMVEIEVAEMVDEEEEDHHQEEDIHQDDHVHAAVIASAKGKVVPCLVIGSAGKQKLLIFLLLLLSFKCHFKKFSGILVVVRALLATANTATKHNHLSSH